MDGKAGVGYLENKLGGEDIEKQNLHSVSFLDKNFVCFQLHTKVVYHLLRCCASEKMKFSVIKK